MISRMTDSPDYLEPYRDAARRYAGGFLSLLWASPDTQAARFDAICRLERFAGRSILDVGCGRADLLDYLIARNATPADYIGIEAIPELATIAPTNDIDARPLSMLISSRTRPACSSARMWSSSAAR